MATTSLNLDDIQYNRGHNLLEEKHIFTLEKTKLHVMEAKKRISPVFILGAIGTLLLLAAGGYYLYTRAKSNKKQTTIAFNEASISFRYPNNMHCHFKENKMMTMKTWSMEGTHSTIEVHEVKTFFFSPVLSERAKTMGKKKETKEITLQSKHHGTLPGGMVKLEDSQGVKSVLEFYCLPITDTELTTIFLIDHRDDFDVPSEEFKTIKKHFKDTFKLKPSLQDVIKHMAKEKEWDK